MSRKPPRRKRECTRFVVVCEAAPDQRTACTLADRVLCERSTWLDDKILESVREWSGLTAESSFVGWTEVKSEADRGGIRAHGHFDGKPGELDARAGRRALLLLARTEAELAGVLLIRDSDNHPERLTGLNQARDYAAWPFVVVIGVAHPKRECWLLAAFQPANDREQRLLKAVRKELGFDPCLESQRLTATDDSAQRSAKRVLAVLCEGARAEAGAGLDQVPLETLKECGQRNGLDSYIRELETRLVPLFR